MTNYKTITLTCDESRIPVLSAFLGTVLNNEEIKTLKVESVKEPQNQFLRKEPDGSTVIEPQYQYTRDDFESDEEWGKYKESVYFAKMGAKVTKLDSPVLGKNAGGEI